MREKIIKIIKSIKDERKLKIIYFFIEGIKGDN